MKHKNNEINIITAFCMILTLSTMALAQDTTTTETCANGAGTVITGAVSGHKYCMSNDTMNWWNAHAWCDGLGRRLFSLDDCEYSGTSTACNDLKNVGGDVWGWTATPKGPSLAYYVIPSSGTVGNYNRSHYLNYAFCY